jgi:hypothetical protein
VRRRRARIRIRRPRWQAIWPGHWVATVTAREAFLSSSPMSYVHHATQQRYSITDNSTSPSLTAARIDRGMHETTVDSIAKPADSWSRADGTSPGTSSQLPVMLFGLSLVHRNHPRVCDQTRATKQSPGMQSAIDLARKLARENVVLLRRASTAPERTSGSHR